MVSRRPIRKTDRIAGVLARDEALVEVFVAASSVFERLQNPIMRKVMARLATVEQAARIAGVDPGGLVARLNRACGVGPARETRTEEETVHDTEATRRAAARPPALERIPESEIVDLDVRDDLRSGREPFRKIMAARRDVPAGGAFRLRAIFEPAPLYDVMAKQGFAHWTERLAEDDWRIWFYPRDDDVAETTAATAASSRSGGSDAGDVEGAAPDGSRTEPDERPLDSVDDSESCRNGRSAPTACDDHASGTAAGRGNVGDSSDPGGDDIVVLDVRGMEPPQPLVATLEALESLPPDGTLVQINVRVPRFLLPRLDERGWSHEIHTSPDGLVRVFIRRADG